MQPTSPFKNKLDETMPRGFGGRANSLKWITSCDTIFIYIVLASFTSSMKLVKTTIYVESINFMKRIIDYLYLLQYTTNNESQVLRWFWGKWIKKQERVKQLWLSKIDLLKCKRDQKNLYRERVEEILT